MVKLVGFIFDCISFVYYTILYGSILAIIIGGPLFLVYMFFHILMGDGSSRGDNSPDPQEQYNP